MLCDIMGILWGSNTVIVLDHCNDVTLPGGPHAAPMKLLTCRKRGCSVHRGILKSLNKRFILLEHNIIQ